MKKLYFKKLYIFTLALVSATYTHDTKMLEKPKENTNPEQDFDRTIYEWSDTFARVLALAKNKHYKVANPETSMIKAIDAFLNDLDPHSSFLDPKTYQRMIESTSGQFYGVGIVIDNTRKTKDKSLTIIDTIPGGPADSVGLQAMDKIVEIDGKSLEGMSTEEAISRLKGKRETKVKVKVIREGQQDLLSFEITRDIVKEQTSLSFNITDYNIQYLSLTTFSEGAAKKIEEILDRARENKYKGLILDLRNNSGGLLTSAIDIAGLFLKKNSLVVITKDKNGNEIEKFYTKRNPVSGSKLPIFVLTNNFTASAAEILAGALKIHSQQNSQTDACHVFLIGSKTFGKGSVQEVIPINNNSAVKITTCLYYLPDDTTIQGTGIEPDFIVDKTFPPTEQMEWFTKSYGREQAYENYIKVNKETDEKKDDEKDDETDDKNTVTGKSQASDKSTEVNSEQNLDSASNEVSPDSLSSKTSEALPGQSANGALLSGSPSKRSGDGVIKKSSWLDRQKKMLQTDNQLREAITLINLLDTGMTFCPENTCNHGKAIQFLKKHYMPTGTLNIVEI